MGRSLTVSVGEKGNKRCFLGSLECLWTGYIAGTVSEEDDGCDCHLLGNAFEIGGHETEGERDCSWSCLQLCENISAKRPLAGERETYAVICKETNTLHFHGEDDCAANHRWNHDSND